MFSTYSEVHFLKRQNDGWTGKIYNRIQDKKYIEDI